MPDEEPWPAMPVLATDPLRFSVICEKSTPLMTGATP